MGKKKTTQPKVVQEPTAEEVALAKEQLDKQQKELQEQVETINTYIDMDMNEFLNRVSAKPLNELRAMSQLLQMEKGRIIQMRTVAGADFAELEPGTDEYKANFFDYIATFVIEQKIADRASIVIALEKMRGVQIVNQTLGISPMIGSNRKPDSDMVGSNRKPN
jgi:hypothetical protein